MFTIEYTIQIELEKLSDEQIVKLHHGVQQELWVRRQKYLEKLAETATITDEKLREIVDSSMQSYTLPLGDYAKVRLALYNNMEQLRLKGKSRFAPLIFPKSTTEHYDMLFSNLADPPLINNAYQGIMSNRQPDSE